LGKERKSFQSEDNTEEKGKTLRTDEKRARSFSLQEKLNKSMSGDRRVSENSRRRGKIVD